MDRKDADFSRVDLHRRIALVLRKEPGLIRDFADRLRSKLATTRSPAAISDNEREWYIILTLWSPLQVIRLLEDSSERAVRLRNHSPFLDLLSTPTQRTDRRDPDWRNSDPRTRGNVCSFVFACRSAPRDSATIFFCIKGFHQSGQQVNIATMLPSISFPGATRSWETNRLAAETSLQAPQSSTKVEDDLQHKPAEPERIKTEVELEFDYDFRND
jgi:hypothetical protein